MSNHCQVPLGLTGVPDLDPADSFSKMGSIFWTHRELLLSWDHQVSGEIKQLLALDLSLVRGSMQSWSIPFWLEKTFCCWLQFSLGRQFSSGTLLLFLCDINSGFLVFVRLLRGSFLILPLDRGSFGTTFGWRLFDTHLSFVALRLLWHSVWETRCSWPGDVWMATSITLFVRALAERLLTEVLSCLRAFSSRRCSLLWSSLRSSNLLFNFSRLELMSAVAFSV